MNSDTGSFPRSSVGMQQATLQRRALLAAKAAFPCWNVTAIKLRKGVIPAWMPESRAKDGKPDFPGNLGESLEVPGTSTCRPWTLDSGIHAGMTAKRLTQWP